MIFRVSTIIACHSPARGLYELHMGWGLRCGARRDLALESDDVYSKSYLLRTTDKTTHIHSIGGHVVEIFS